MQYVELDSRDIKGAFYSALADEQGDVWSPGLAVAVDSDRETETYRHLGQVPMMREWVGNRQVAQPNKYVYTLRNKIWEGTLGFDLEDLRRDKTGEISRRTADLATRSNEHWDDLTSGLITDGEASPGLCYDGQFFFDTDHNESGTNQTNDLTATEIPSANVSNADAPTAAEWQNIITEACHYFGTLKDDQGQPINTNVNDVVFMVGSHIYAAGLTTAIYGNGMTGDANQPAVGLRSRGFSINSLFNPRLSATADKVYAFLRSGRKRPFIHQQEVDVQTQIQGAGSADEFYSNQHVFGIKAVRNAGYAWWQKALLITLS